MRTFLLLVACAMGAGCRRPAAAPTAEPTPPTAVDSGAIVIPEERDTPPPPSVPEAPEADSGVFSPPEGARRLCDQHVNAPPLHVAWSSYALAEAPREVVARYRARRFRTDTPEPDVNPDPEHLTLRGPGDVVVTIYPSGENNSHPHCATEPTDQERTVLLLSRAVR
ncbi:MAG: hypothetical protein HY909_03970 [Deltaproteobacteria bacterium]|nr:hypothetical protein [Deltaproteobacteria bacterium]